MSDSFSEAVAHRTVTGSAIETFGGLTGDYAQMHFDLDFGPANGMGGTIAHGLLSGAWSLGALAQSAPDRLGVGDPGAYLAGYRVKFQRMVYIGDLFSLRWKSATEAATKELEPSPGRLDTEFEIVNQKGEVSTSGAVSVGRSEGPGVVPAMPAAPAPLAIADWDRDAVPLPIFADDMVEVGPRGESLGRTVSETDLVQWTNFTGELNPAFLNAEFARGGRFGARIAPPMWVFCLGFGDYLRDLLSVSMPSSGFAGHLGDSWRMIAPVYVGDTLRTRHRPVSFQASGSRPGMGIVEFALHVVNQRGEIVLDGRVVMMMSARPA
jgi:acyl dehydratase